METWVKYFHFVLNILSMLAGILLAGFGIFLQFGFDLQELFVNGASSKVLFYGMISLGSVVFLLGLLGAVGSCFKNKCLLSLYLSLNILFLLAQVALLVYILIEKDQIKSRIPSVWKDLNNKIKFSIQDRFNCCGYLSGDEWETNYPQSCFNDTSTNTTATIWTTVCRDSIFNYLEENVIYAIVLTGIVILLEVLQVVVTCLLIREVTSTHDNHETGRVNPGN